MGFELSMDLASKKEKKLRLKKVGFDKEIKNLGQRNHGVWSKYGFG